METPLAQKLLKVRDLLVEAVASNTSNYSAKNLANEALKELGHVPGRVQKMEELMADAVNSFNAQIEKKPEDPFANLKMPNVDDVKIGWEEPKEITTSAPKRRSISKKKKF